MRLLIMTNKSKENEKDGESIVKFIARHKWRNEPVQPNKNDAEFITNKMNIQQQEKGLQIIILVRNDRYDMDDAVSLVHFIDDFPGWENEPTFKIAVEKPLPL